MTSPNMLCLCDRTQPLSLTTKHLFPRYRSILACPNGLLQISFQLEGVACWGFFLSQCTLRVWWCKTCFTVNRDTVVPTVSSSWQALDLVGPKTILNIQTDFLLHERDGWVLLINPMSIKSFYLLLSAAPYLKGRHNKLTHLKTWQLFLH